MQNQTIRYGNVFKVTRRDTLEDIRNHFKMMQEHGFDTVVIWPACFWWEEKGENYPFHTGQQILRIAEEYGIGVIMELAGQLTSMEYMPDFLNKPEYYPTTQEGHREYGQSSFGFVNYFHPEVKALIAEHYKKAAQAYMDFPALLGYDVFNETMYRSFDEYTMGDFRNWLIEKYKTIDALNAVWERTYSDFSQITFEPWKWLSVMPEVDYCSYRKAAIARFITPWCDTIREIDREHMIIVDNIHSMVSPLHSYSRPQEDYSLCDFADKMGMSFYPKGVGGCFEPCARWEIFDGFFDASHRKGFYISEMQTHIQAMFNPTTCVSTYELKLWCAEAYAAGAEAIIYWMWRPFDTGLQTLGRGLVNYRGKPTERLDMAVTIKNDILSFGKISPVRSRVAILYDPLCHDIQRTYTAPYGIEDKLYLKSIYGAYKAFCKLNVRPDIVRIDEIKNYDLVILTNHIVLSDSDSAALSEYVRGGGHILADGRFAVVNEFAVTHSVIPGGSFNPLVGEVYFDTDNGDSTVILPRFGDIKAFAGRHICEVTDGDTVALFKDGESAIVKKKTDRGSVTTVNASVWYEYAFSGDDSILNFALSIIDEFHLTQVFSDSSLMLRLSEDDENYYLFAFNYTEEEICASATLCQSSLTLPVCVPPNDVKIIKIVKGERQ